MFEVFFSINKNKSYSNGLSNVLPYIYVCIYIYRVFYIRVNAHEMIDWIELNKRAPYRFTKFAIIIEILNMKNRRMRAREKC